MRRKTILIVITEVSEFLLRSYTMSKFPRLTPRFRSTYINPVIYTILLLLIFPMTAYHADCQENTAAGRVPVLTLEEALSVALTDNPKIDNAQLDVQKAHDSIGAAKTKRYPEFDVGLYEAYHITDEAFEFKKGAFGTFPDIGPIPAENTKIATVPDFTTFLTASAIQPISQLYEISLLINQRKVEKSLFDEHLRSKRHDIVDNVKKEYYNILKSQSELIAAEEKIVFLKELYVLVNRYVEQERALESESLEVKARLGKAQYEQFKLQNTLATQKERLNKLLGRDIGTPFNVTPVGGATPYIIEPDVAQEEALEQRPEVRAAKLDIEFAENEVKLTKAKYIPEVGVQFSYSANFNVELLPENIATVGVYAKWDVFDWGRKQKEIAKKRKSVLQAENNLSEAESQVLIDVNTKIRKLEEASSLILVTEMEQAAAREKLRVEMNKFKQGSALLQQVLEAESSLEDKNNKYQKAVLDYWTARANLEKAMGEE